MNSIADLIQEREIKEVLHFTTNNGIVGILTSGYLRSRYKLSDDQFLEHILYPNASSRPEDSIDFDKKENWIDYVNLSISEINTRYFKVSGQWHKAKDIWWGILAFDPTIMEHDGVYFATTNNSYEHCERNQGGNGFNALFSSPIKCKGIWQISRMGRPNQLPTCEQAEVLYPQKISSRYLKTIYVSNESNYDAVVGWLLEYNVLDVNVIISEEKFRGMPNK